VIRVLGRTEEEEWEHLLSENDLNDVFLSPAYLELNEAVISGESECVVYEDRDSLVAYPYLRRPIAGSACFDISSPYGYGGAVELLKGSDVKQFYNVFHEYCRDTKIVSEFIRFHPMLENHTDANIRGLDTVCHQPVVVVEYDQEEHSFGKAIRKEVLKKVRKAERNHIRVVEDIAWDYYEDFVEMYRGLMDCKGASRFYFFNDAFFRSIRRTLSDRASLLVALCKGRMIGGLLILHSQPYAYNYLSCSDRDHDRLGTNDLLQFKAVDWASRGGLKAYLLGGGRSGEDSLFRFKAKFSPQRRAFFLGKRIHLPKIYDALCEEKMKQEGIRPEEFISRSWFPLYRSSPSRQGGGSRGV
jgi:hypothetical protein